MEPDPFARSWPHYPVATLNVPDKEQASIGDNSLLLDLVDLNLTMTDIEAAYRNIESQALTPIKACNAAGMPVWQYCAGDTIIARDQLAAWLATH